MVVQVLVTCLASPSLDVTLAAMRATSAFIQVCCLHGSRLLCSPVPAVIRLVKTPLLSHTGSIALDAEGSQLKWHIGKRRSYK